MMTLTLRRDVALWRGRGFVSLCVSRFAEYFDVPEGTRRIWITISTKYRRGWAKIHVDHAGRMTKFDDEDAFEFIVFETRHAVERGLGLPLDGLDQQNLYVKVEY